MEKFPVIVGVGRVTSRSNGDDISRSKGPLLLGLDAFNRCLSDVNIKDKDRFIEEIEGFATVQMFYEIRWQKRFKGKKPFKNFPRSLLNKINKNNSVKVENCIESAHGGNGPQFLINYFSEKISKGDLKGPIFIGGIEANGVFDKAVKEGKTDLLTEVRGFCDKTDVSKKTVVNKHLFPTKLTGEESDLLRIHALHGLFTPLNSLCFI